MAATVSSEWLNACSGCEISILNIGDAILDLIPSKLSFVHIPALVDSKYFGPLGDGNHITLPEATVGFLSGGIRTQEHKEVAEEMRKKVKFLIAIGTCATDGGIPAQANMWPVQELTDKVYRKSVTTDSADTPKDVVPPLLDKVMAVDEVVKVDIHMPGCPPHPDLIAEAILALLDGKTEWKLPERSVCDTCPVVREKKAAGGADIKRTVQNIAYTPGQPVSQMRCIMEQGILCMGAVTLAGCAGKTGIPRCIQAYMPCEGCFGPIRKTANPLIDMVSALSSIGQNINSLQDRRAVLNRFCGGHGKLRPLPTPPKK